MRTPIRITSPAALVVLAGAAGSQPLSPPAAFPGDERPDTVRKSVSIGQQTALTSPVDVPEGEVYSSGFARGFETFDSEPILLDNPESLVAFVAAAPGGQSAPFNGLLNPAGVSQIGGFDIGVVGDVVPLDDNLYVVFAETVIEPLTDGFLPLGVTFGGGTIPVTTLGWSGGDTGLDRDGNPDALSPTIPGAGPSGEFDVLAIDFFAFDNGVPLIASNLFLGAPILDQRDVSWIVTIPNAAGSGIDDMAIQYLVQPSDVDTELLLRPVDDCLGASENQLVVEVDVRGLRDLAVGGQFRLEYDASLLDFVSADAGDAPFVREVFEFVDESAGVIDFAVGVTNGDPGTALPTTMARLTFDLPTEFCSTEDLVRFSTSPLIPSRVTNNAGADLGASLISLTPIENDNTAPVVTAPADIVINADAGLCSATLDRVETFSDPASVVLCEGSSSTPLTDCWTVDREAPAVFEQTTFNGEPVLRHSVNAADLSTDAFRNTQGRKISTSIPIGGTWSVDVYVGSDFTTQVRRAGMWASTENDSGAVTGFPIIGVANTDPTVIGTQFNAPSSGFGDLRFRVFTQDSTQPSVDGISATAEADPDAAGFVSLGLPAGFSLDRWWTLECTLTEDAYEFRVYDDTGAEVLAFDDAVTFGSTRTRDNFLQVFNFGDTYDIYWDNADFGPSGAVVRDNCDSQAGTTVVRSDDPSLGLDDPFPVGTTTVTYSAIDRCGNEGIATQLVTVRPVTELDVAVELAGVDAGPFTRCITFELTRDSGTVETVEAELEFVGGLASGTIEVPCGAYVCISARDALHTLARVDADDFGIDTDEPTIFASDFTSAGSMDDDSLIGGNLNDDAFIDILDFGVFISQFGTVFGGDPLNPNPNTDCATAGPHADIDGDGRVLSDDFTFISTAFFSFAEACGSRAGSGIRTAALLDAGPVGSISVEELFATNRPELVYADLDQNGMVDQADIAAFLAGARSIRQADVNGDYQLTPADFNAWVVLYNDKTNANHRRADIDGNGRVEPADALVLLERLRQAAL